MTPIPSLLIETPAIPPPTIDPQASIKAEIGRLMHAAIISPRFREHLLANPAATIETGYLGESFHFPREVNERIRQLRAGTLEEFASQVLEFVEIPSMSEMAVLRY